jgi:hypothetical protein
MAVADLSPQNGKRWLPQAVLLRHSNGAFTALP